VTLARVALAAGRKRRPALPALTASGLRGVSSSQDEPLPRVGGEGQGLANA
jgi:hypothetical protein